MTERQAKILDLYRKGFTLQEIGYEFNITRERVRQIVGKITKNQNPEQEKKDHFVNQIIRRQLNSKI